MLMVRSEVPRVVRRSLFGSAMLLVLLVLLHWRNVFGSEPELRFRPPATSPMIGKVAALGDGQWWPVPDPIRYDAEPLLFATRLHPDGGRRSAEVFVVAVELAQVRLQAVAGTEQPEATTPAGRAYLRHGLIPLEHQLVLLAAFNGGSTSQPEQRGMHLNGVTLAAPQPGQCTLLGLNDGGLRIASWATLAVEAEQAERESRLLFWRQSAPCMYEGGKLNPELRVERPSVWGATPDGEPAMRRSAVGLDANRRWLYVGVSNDTTARALAEAVHHAGASDVAQLDVGWSQPKFLVFPFGPEGQRQARSLFEGFVFAADEYVKRPSTRDFFYLVRREPAHHR